MIIKLVLHKTIHYTTKKIFNGYISKIKVLTVSLC